MDAFQPAVLPRIAFGAIRLAAAQVAATILATGGWAWAAEPILTLSRGPNDVATLELTLEELAALPQLTIATENEFADGLVAYRGPLVRDVIELKALGDAETLRFIAANDYHVEIPTRDFRVFDVILAMEADGKRLSRRDKGPLWLMYPITDNPELTEEPINSRLIWQVVRIESP